MRPSAFLSPGGWKMWTVPSRLYSTLSPIRSSAIGSCCSAGRYSFCTIEGGTFQVGFMVMHFIGSLNSGVGIVGLPVTILVCQAVAQRRHARILQAGLEHRSAADARGTRLAVVGARLGELGAKCPVARMRRI